jgi:hypothetical protein
MPVGRGLGLAVDVQRTSIFLRWLRGRVRAKWRTTISLHCLRTAPTALKNILQPPRSPLVRDPHARFRFVLDCVAPSVEIRVGKVMHDTNFKCRRFGRAWKASADLRCSIGGKMRSKIVAHMRGDFPRSGISRDSAILANQN